MKRSFEILRLAYQQSVNRNVKLEVDMKELITKIREYAAVMSFV